MDFGWALVLGFMWLVFNVLTSKKRPPGKPGRTEDPRTKQLPAQGEPVRGDPMRGDPTQREGSRLEHLLRDFERAMNDASAGSRASRPTTAPEGVNDGETAVSLERPVRVVSVESAPTRVARVRVDQDDAAEAIARRRIDQASARDRVLTKADHAAFDQRIRQEPADHTATRAYTGKQLRDAMVWREILGRPVALRNEER